MLKGKVRALAQSLGTGMWKLAAGKSWGVGLKGLAVRMSHSEKSVALV